MRAQTGLLSTAPDAAPAIHWTLWCSAASVAASVIGVHWDIAWHQSIGRDTFWSPPHLSIYAGAVLAGAASATLILAATFGPDRSGGVRVLGLRGPLGALAGAWGGLAMLTSAPFDDWWHGAYGLDVKILSPPHIVLALGILAIQFGVLLLLVSALNRSSAEEAPRRRALFLTVAGLVAMPIG